METLFGLDYPTLWFLVVGFLFAGYAILDGFDFGAGALHLLFPEEEERRIALNAVGPVWDGNEVWLVIGGGALFAGFPNMYATFFSALYVPFMLFLIFIIFRAISIEIRSKEPGKTWRKTWDIAYSVSSIMIAFLLGVVLGNVLQGIAIGDKYLYQGDGFLEFLNPYAILTGLTSLTLFIVHGANYLLLKTEGKLFLRLTKIIKEFIITFIVIFSITTLYTLIYIPHLSDRIQSQPAAFLIPLFAFLSIANLPRLISLKRYGQAFFFSSLTIGLLLILVFLELYPNLLISTVDDKYTLNIYNSASSTKSLKIMLSMVVIGTPLILTYTIFVYKTFSGKVKLDEHSY